MKRGKVIVITLNYNQNEFTIKCVESILKSYYKDFYIVLVDNGSSLKNQEDLIARLPINKNFECKIVKENRGYVGGINYALEYAEKLNPDYVMIMNNDTIIDPNAIDEFVKTVKLYNNRAIITGKVYEYDEPNKIQDIGYIYANRRYLKIDRIGMNENDNQQYDNIEERDMIDDIFWLFPFDLYRTIKGYSNFFWFNSEQADFALRAKYKGYKLVYTPYAKLWHKGSVSIGGREMNPKLAFWTVQSSLILRYIHLRRRDFILYYLMKIESVLRTLIKSIYVYIIKRENIFDYALAKYKGLVYFNKWVFRKNENTGINPYS